MLHDIAIDNDALGRLIGEFSEFTTHFNKRRPLLMRPSAPPVELLSLRDVDELLSCSLLKAPFVNLTDIRGGVPLSTFTRPLRTLARDSTAHVDGERVVAELRAGRTMVLSGLESWYPPVVRFLRSLADVFPGTLLEGAMFVTPPDAQGLPVHRDPGHLFIVQVNGTKHWTVFEAPQNGMWTVGSIEDVGDVALECTLLPGDVLFLPSGAPHLVRGDRGLSAHLSLGISEPPIDVALRAVAQLLTVPPGVMLRPEDQQSLHQALEDLRMGLAVQVRGLDLGVLAERTREIHVRQLPDPDRDALSQWARELDAEVKR